MSDRPATDSTGPPPTRRGEGRRDHAQRPLLHAHLDRRRRPGPAALPPDDPAGGHRRRTGLVLHRQHQRAGRQHQRREARQPGLHRRLDLVLGRGSRHRRPRRAKTDELWNSMVEAWFPEGKDSPDLALLRSSRTPPSTGTPRAAGSRRRWRSRRRRSPASGRAGTASPSSSDAQRLRSRSRRPAAIPAMVTASTSSPKVSASQTRRTGAEPEAQVHPRPACVRRQRDRPGQLHPAALGAVDEVPGRLDLDGLEVLVAVRRSRGSRRRRDSPCHCGCTDRAARRERGTKRSTDRGKYQPPRPLPSCTSHGHTCSGGAGASKPRSITTSASGTSVVARPRRTRPRRRWPPRRRTVSSSAPSCSTGVLDREGTP